MHKHVKLAYACASKKHADHSHSCIYHIMKIVEVNNIKATIECFKAEANQCVKRAIAQIDFILMVNTFAIKPWLPGC